MLIMKGYAYYLQRPLVTLSRKRPQNAKTVLKYTSLIILAGSVATMLLDLDKFMLGLFKDIDNVAYYGVAIYIATVIAVPLRAMHQITYPMVAAMLNQNRREEMKELYQKSSISLLVISGLLFLLITCNIQSLYALINPNYAVGLYVVLLIGAAKLFDTTLGINNAIVFNSDYYRLVLYAGVFLVLIAVLLNVLLISKYGIYGAAIATFIASLSYGLIKVMIVKQKFGIQPFTVHTLKGIVLISLFFVVFYFWKIELHPILSIGLKSFLISFVDTLLIYKLKLSVDINTAINTVLKRNQ